MSEVLVLYQISNEFGTPHPSSHHHNSKPNYNAYYMSRKNGITLSTIKQSCRALQSIHPNGADGYHWRVRIDEKPNTSHSSSGPTASASSSSSPSPDPDAVAFSWWDVQDENARLPVKECTPKELKLMLVPKPPQSDSDVVTQEVTKAAKGAMKYMGKAMNAVSGSSSGGHHGHHGMEDDDDFTAVRTPVICFKLLDLGKVRGGGARAAPARRSAPVRAARRAAAPAAQPSKQQQQRQPPARAPISAGAPRIPSHQARQQQQQRAPSAKACTPPTADLMGFNAGPTPAAPAAHNLHHANSMPARMSTPTGAKPGETRAEKLKREYAKKNATSNRVWDDIDQRWVEGPVKNGETTAPISSSVHSTASTSAGTAAGGVDKAAAGVKGIAISRDSAIGKSASVQAAVNARVNDMEQSQQKAIEELRNREAEKAKADAEEDVVRQRLDGKLKEWSEEHGQKKQLRALLANLHTILWEGSGWKQVSLADVLDDSKVKRVYHKASRVVHPDKIGHLDAEKRFVAKRVFDALTQAKVEFEEGKR